MPIKQFSIKNTKNITSAECPNVPSMMIIAGPNGIGKSTLLYSLYQQNCTMDISGRVIYIPPHRVWTKQNLRSQYLFENTFSYGQGLTSASVPSISGLSMRGGNRAPDTSDETSSLIKYSLGQLELRRQNVIKQRVDQFKDGDKFEDVKKIYQPLKDLTRELLPHIEFERIDLVQGGIVRCIWKRAKGLSLDKDESVEIDIEDLSSGEKAILILFMQFIEVQIENNIKELEGENITEKDEDLIVLIDEPELHLHPILESRVLAYLRKLIENNNLQFIIATHSPVLLNNAKFDELYLFSPPKEEMNQLNQLTDEDSRLQALREICGETYPLTASRNIICIEGKTPEEIPKKPTDKKILEILCPEISQNVLIPMGGKNTVIESAKRLRSILPSSIPFTKVLALVDKDQDPDSKEDWVFRLPVCMIENLLLLPEALNDFLEKYRENASLKNLDEVKKALKGITDSLKEDEIRLRIKRKLPYVYGDYDGNTIEEIKINHQHIVKEISEKIPSDEEIKKIIEDSENEITSIIKENNELKHYRGKVILKEFYEKYVKNLTFSYYTFCMELTKEVTANEDGTKELKKLITEINLNKI